MNMHFRRLQTLATLPNLVIANARGTGAIPLTPDTRLAAMSAWVSLQKQISKGVPGSYSLAADVTGQAYDQGTEDSCVAYSIAGMQSIFGNILYKKWMIFDAEDCYRSNGGTGDNGILTKSALVWDETTGFRDITSGIRYKISSYAFADPTSAAGQSVIKAAIASNDPAVLAMLLPTDFGSQWNASGDCSGSPTTSYHQVCIIGYDAARCYFLNSWGPTWGANGKGSVTWAYLTNPTQDGWAYAYTATDTHQPGFAPFFAHI